MKRYELSTAWDSPAMLESPVGDYMLYEDHQQAVDAELDDSTTLSNRLQAVIDDLQRQLAEVTAERDLARRELAIADAHRKDLSRTLDAANATLDRLRGIRK